jgi:hypothetical protein
LGKESSVHSTIQSAVDRGDWHIGFDQLLVLDLVGTLFFSRAGRAI